MARGIGLANSFLIISSLSLYEYGVFQLLLATYSFSAEVEGLGGFVINDLARFIGEKKEAQAKKLFYEISFFRIGAGILFWLIAFFGAPLLSFRFGPDFIFIIRILSFLFLHDALLAFFRSLLKNRLQFAVLASRTSVSKVSQLLILLGFFTWRSIGLREVVLALVISAFISTLSLWPAFWRSYKPWRGLKMAEEKILFKALMAYGKWEVFSKIFSRAISFFQPWVIKVAVSTEAVAVFSIADTMITFLKELIPTKTLSSLVPREVADRERSQRIFSRASKYLMFFAFLAAGGGLIAAYPFIKLFFPQYLVSLPYFYAMLPLVPLTALGATTGTFITALRKQKFLFLRMLTKNFLTTVFLLTLVPLFKIWGMVTKEIMMTLIMFSLTCLYLKKIKPGISLRWREIFYFDGEDRIFLRNIFGDLKRYARKKMPFNIL